MVRRILLLGSRGQLATELQVELSSLGELQVVGRATPQRQVDFLVPESLPHIVEALQPDIIVNAAAYTAVDQAQQEVDAAYRINAEAPARLARAAAACGALLVHYSTDYVFAGDARSAYQESDAPAPQSVYGQTKLAGEEGIRAAGCAHLILRTSWVYGLHGHNFMRTMRRLARERESLRIVADQVGAPTWSRHIAQATSQILAQLQGAEDYRKHSGTYHLTAAGQCSWFEFARRIIAHQQGREALAVREVVPITSAEYPLPAPRPAWSVLDCNKLANTFGVRLPHWETALAQVQGLLDEAAI